MKRAFAFILLFFPAFANGQIINTDIIKQYAIPLSNQLDDTNNPLFDTLKNHKLIMIGETHGTQESVKFLYGLVNDFSFHHKKVIVGFEVTVGIMHDSLKNLSYEQVINSDFFKKDYDGRENSTEAGIIVKLSSDTNVTLVFFDVTSKSVKVALTDSSKYSHDSFLMNLRDSLMYKTLNDAVKNEPSATVITISGNYHTMIERKGSFAYFLRNDSLSEFKNSRILTINNLYESGSMLNDEGKGLKLSDVSQKLPYYGDAVTYDNYLLLTPYPLMEGYDGILFTRKITVAMPCKN